MSTNGYSLENDHIPGEHVNEYLYDYARHFDLLRYIRFNSSVQSAVDAGDLGWTLTVLGEKADSEAYTAVKAGKLIVATGLTSQPFLPTLKGRESFGAPIYHTSEFAKVENGLGPYKKVVLLSGAKFSWDIACEYASAGIQVDWIIRESGHGPCWMTPSRLTPLKIIPELLPMTRLVTWLSPCIWGDADGFTSIRNFLHQHWLGRKFVDGFFNKMSHSVLEQNKYDLHPETAKLKPWDDLFYIGTNRGLLNYGLDFFEFVRNGTIRVHVADITSLSHHTVHLSDDQELEADVLICGTGWKDAPPLDFVTKRDLGLPGFTSSASKFIPEADAEIFKKCPKLRDQPPPRSDKPKTDYAREIGSETYRLYRFMVPPAFVQSRTLAFAGAYRSPATHIIAQVQALWITAFFENQIPALSDPSINIKAPSSAQSTQITQSTIAAEADAAPDPEFGKAEVNEATSRIMYETVLHTQFGKWRNGRGFGARFPELWFDCLPYVDLLLVDIGVQNRRKNSWWGERFTPYFPKDYAGIIAEYVELKDQRARLVDKKD